MPNILFPFEEMRRNRERAEENRRVFDGWHLEFLKQKAKPIFVFGTKPDGTPTILAEVDGQTAPQEIIKLLERTLNMMKQGAPIKT